MNHDEMAGEATGMMWSLIKKSWPLLLGVVVLNLTILSGILYGIKVMFFGG